MQISMKFGTYFDVNNLASFNLSLNLDSSIVQVVSLCHQHDTDFILLLTTASVRCCVIFTLIIENCGHRYCSMGLLKEHTVRLC
jgi:hypothetical protein